MLTDLASLVFAQPRATRLAVRCGSIGACEMLDRRVRAAGVARGCSAGCSIWLDRRTDWIAGAASMRLSAWPNGLARLPDWLAQVVLTCFGAWPSDLARPELLDLSRWARAGCFGTQSRSCADLLTATARLGPSNHVVRAAQKNHVNRNC